MSKRWVIFLMGFFLMTSSCEKSVYIPPTLPDSVSFSKHIIPIFNANCNSSNCHGGAFPQGNFSLEPSVAYQQLWDKSMIDTLHPESSVLYVQMNNAGYMIMPPSGRIDTFYIKEVLRWIEQKGKNN
jgi:hypothetical protein